jgi:hypothetical protein
MGRPRSYPGSSRRPFCIPSCVITSASAGPSDARAQPIALVDAQIDEAAIMAKGIQRYIANGLNVNIQRSRYGARETFTSSNRLPRDARIFGAVNGEDERVESCETLDCRQQL